MDDRGTQADTLLRFAEPEVVWAPLSSYHRRPLEIYESFVSLNAKGKERHRRSFSERRRNIFKYLIVVHFDSGSSR